MTIVELKQISNMIKRWVTRDIAPSCRKPIPLTPGDGTTQISVLNVEVNKSDISEELMRRMKVTAWCTLLKDSYLVKRFDFKIEVNEKEDEKNTVQIRVKLKCGKCYKRSNKPIPRGDHNFSGYFKVK